MNDEFYIGWEARAAAGIGSTVRRFVVVLALTALLLAVVTAASQRLIGASTFEWGTIRQFSGTLKLMPYPHLLVARPGQSHPQPDSSVYYLVGSWKFGLKTGTLAALDGQSVSLKGTLIYRGNQTMIETRPEWIEPSTNLSRRAVAEAMRQALGRLTLKGEIVDSKCFLGVMNPGQLTPHRACAIRCISGGVPPVLLVRQKDGPPAYLLLVSAEGRPVNREVLDLVAEPVEIVGDVERQGELLILRADPKTYRRL